jgi:6-phosphogluconate dehydrogenase
MTNQHPQPPYEIGMVGLGVMGRNLLLNVADHGSRWRPVIQILLVAKTQSM